MLAMACACVTAPIVSPDVLAGLQLSKRAHLRGVITGFAGAAVLNREDFVWAIAPSPDSRRVAFVRLGARAYQLSVWSFGDVPHQEWDVEIGPIEYDVEAVAWSPDGQHLAAVSKDGSVRVFAASTGALERRTVTDEPLVSLAFEPRGGALALGSRRGLVTLLSMPALEFVAETRAHTDEVRGLVFAASGQLYSASWDRSVGVLALRPAADSLARRARVRFERRGGVLSFKGQVGTGLVQLTPDARVATELVLTQAAAATAGIEASVLRDEVRLQTANGPVLARVAKGRAVSFKQLKMPVDVAVCDACVPPGAQGVVGQPLLERLSLAIDEASNEVVLEGARVSVTSHPMTLELVTRHTFGGAVNDITIDARGQVLGLALSQTKAERTREVYEREKRREVPPLQEWDCAARVDATTGQVLEKLQGHRGVVATASISPDGQSLVTGGWDKAVRLHGAKPIELGWAVRQVRFSPDGRWLAVAAWTPQNPLGNHASDPAALVAEVRYLDPVVVAPAER